jgi:Skp family chaperone for outer membrane proteins
MKKMFPTGLLALSLFAFCCDGLAADFKIATVDLRKVFDTYYKTILASAANSNNIVERDKELNAMMEARRKYQDNWTQEKDKSENQAVPAEERAKSRKAADDLAVQIQIQNETISNYYARTEIKRHDDMVQHVADLTTEITNVMNAMAKRQGYTMVLDRTALTMTGNPLVLYTSGENDLTDALMKELNSTAPALPAPETNKPADTPRPPAGTNARTLPAPNPTNSPRPLPGANTAIPPAPPPRR